MSAQMDPAPVHTKYVIGVHKEGSDKCWHNLTGIGSLSKGIEKYMLHKIFWFSWNVLDQVLTHCHCQFCPWTYFIPWDSISIKGSFFATSRIERGWLSGLGDPGVPKLKFLGKSCCYISNRPKQCFTVLPEPNRTSQSKFCLPNRNRTEPNM